ncbi:D(2) dopamine receptor-like [Mytilus edulis]|uniref:D(2) dopamine receptor-like n=1 Tax=Mytilus edulis TaxID=6550 RepID=UPI0039EFD963
MNNRTTVKFGELDRVNDEMAAVLLPVILIVGVYMIAGIFGNPLVIYYYGYLVKPSPSYHFIVTMAVFDLIVCLVSMPLEIVDMRFNYKFPDATACKIFRFGNYFCSMASSFILIAIAADRYRKVCQPFQTQITFKTAKIITGCLCLAAFFVASPSFIIYDIRTVNISATSGLVGYDCTAIREARYTLYISIFNGICFLIFICCITTLTVLYILIAKKLWHLKRFRVMDTTRKISNMPYTPPTSSFDLESYNKPHSTVVRSTGAVPVNIKASNDDKNILHGCNDKKNSEIASSPTGKHFDSETPFTKFRRVVLHCCVNSKIQNLDNEFHEPGTMEISTNTTDLDTEARKMHIRNSKNQIHQQYIHLKKYTLLMVSISVGFVVSFLPYLGLMTWQTLISQYEVDLMSNLELVLYNIFFRSWLISSVVNPIIYGFFNTEFRSFFFKNIRKCICFCFIKSTKADIQSKQEASQTI